MRPRAESPEALVMLATGATVAAVARALGLNRRTLDGILKRHPDIRTRQLAAQAAELLRQASEIAPYRRNAAWLVGRSAELAHWAAVNEVGTP